jgi:hypothetical protein
LTCLILYVNRGIWHVWKKTERHTLFWWGKLKEIGHLEDGSLDGKTLKIDNKETRWEYMDWIDLSQDSGGFF